MRTHPLLKVTFLLSAALVLSMGVAPPAALARTAPPPVTPTWDSADVTGDGVIDVRDVFFVVRHFGERCTAKRRAVSGDVNRDCRVDGLDLSHVLREAYKARRTPTNAAPQPKADVASTLEDVEIAITVLANDVDPDGDALRLVSATAGRLGTTAVRPDGSVRYSPARDAYGSDTFSYTVADARGSTATASVSVAIAPVNDPPAVTATVSASSGTAPLDVTFDAVGTDVDGDPLTYTWSFGDGLVGTGPRPAHTYAGAGAFNATVVASDGVATSLASLVLSVAPAPEGRPGAYVVDTVAGTGEAGRSGEGGLATLAQLFDPRQVVVAADGSFYVAEALRIVRVDSAGTLTGARALPGDGSGDEGPSIAVGPDGAVYYTDGDVMGSCGEGGYYAEIRVRRLSPAGSEDPVVATWAGGGYVGPCSPSAKLAIDGEGVFYLSAGYYVAKLLPGAAGEPAWALGVPESAYALAADPGGGVFVGGYASVLRIAADGTFAPLAGTGEHGSAGDGGPAINARVGAVSGLTVCPDGTVTFLEFDLSSGTPRIREVTPDGLIATIGGGSSGFNGDGQAALDTAFRFSLSAGIASLPDGGFYVTDRDNARVRRLSPVTGTGAHPAAERPGPQAPPVW